MITAWRIASDTPAYTADDMQGTGAKITGGRWNKEGVPLVYSASNIALACLETLAHLNAGGLPLNRYLVAIHIPETLWTAAERLPATQRQHIGWDAIPAGKISIDFGSQWAQDMRSALLLVPSVIVPEEMNVLINPLHPDAASIHAEKRRKWTYSAIMR